MRTVQRWSTVHDLATLRLHEDGSRVQNSDSNLRSRRTKYAARDARGNWFAKDAGGIGTVKRRRTIVKEVHGQEGEVFDLDGVTDSGEDNADEKEQGTGAMPHKPQRKRLRFNEEMDFLSSAPSTSAQQHRSSPNELSKGGSEVNAESLRTPPPSSDLLKYLHYFATSYYTATGHLYNAPREYKQEQKARRLNQITAKASAGPSDMHSERLSSNEPILEDDDSIQENGHKKERTGGKSNPKPRRQDMYKMFDGSALMAIGMLLEHHVEQSLSGEMPEEWVNAMDALPEDEIESDDEPRRRSSRNRKKQDTPDPNVESAQEDFVQSGSDGEAIPAGQQRRRAKDSSAESEDDSD